MAELEKLEEAFSRSKNDCTQLCLSLNEERNLTKKISSELEMLRLKVKELESSEDRLDKTEQSLVSELEKLKLLTLSFVSERKYLNEKEKENEKLIKELTQKLEQNKKMNRDYTRNASNLLERNDLRIEDAIIKPVIIDKDVKKIMGGSGTEPALEKQKSASKPGPNKVTSSITIYPSDSGSPRAVPGETPQERHMSTSNIQVGLPEVASVSNHISSPFELSIHKHDVTLQLSEAERTGDGSLKNRPETVVSRSSIIIKPSDPVERNSHAPTAETIRWKSHSAPLEAGSSDARHVTVRNAWKSRDLHTHQPSAPSGGPLFFPLWSSSDFYSKRDLCRL
uniref:Leucine zipper protein 1 n=1 Tax=Moschus moschiferus TaxID=68415 RepID=A0A8C6EEY8_MOSMO